MEDHLKSFKGYWIAASAIIGIGTIASLAISKGDFLIWLAYHRNPFLDYYFYYITKAGEPIGFILVGLVLLIFSWRKMVFVPMGGLVSTVLTYILKTYFYHERPSIFLNRIHWMGPTDILDYHLLMGHTSFPSGHSMAAWTLYTLTAAMLRKSWVSVICLWLAVSVSLSRIYLMAHFLEDVVFGAAVGCLIAFGLKYIYNQWMKKSTSM